MANRTVRDYANTIAGQARDLKSCLQWIAEDLRGAKPEAPAVPREATPDGLLGRLHEAREHGEDCLSLANEIRDILNSGEQVAGAKTGRG